MGLSNEHIAFIEQDLRDRKVVMDDLGDELLDHVCSAVEARMANGERFMDAYLEVIRNFGYNTGLQRTQQTTWQSHKTQYTVMIGNHLIIAWRSLLRNKLFASINILGLAAGIAASLLIVVFIAYEFTFDKHHQHAERIYRLDSDMKLGTIDERLALAPPAMAAALQHDYPEIEATCRFRTMGPRLVRPASLTENTRESSVAWADSTFFTVFTSPLLQGDARTTLSEPNTVAISRAMADKYFPGTQVLGQSMLIDNRNHTVTAVFENMPANGHFRFDILIAMGGLNEAQRDSYLSSNFNTYLLLKPGSDPRAIESKLRLFVDKYVMPQAAGLFGPGVTLEKFEAGGNQLSYMLTPLLNIHLDSERLGDFQSNGNRTYLYLLASVAVFIVVIACINFMNMSTARSASRAREVGIRKVMGSLRTHLVRQFMTESFLVTLFAFVVGLLIAWLALPSFRDLAQRELSIPFSDPMFYVVLAGAVAVVGLAAGFYPSLMLSAFQPVKVLRGKSGSHRTSGSLRNALVVFQFVVSIVLVIGTLTVHRQVNYILTSDVGFEKQNVMLVHDAGALKNELTPFCNEISQNNFVVNTTASGFLPINTGWRNNEVYYPFGATPNEDNAVLMQNWFVDYEYMPTLGMKMLSGRMFSRDFLSDSSAVVLNETALEHFGIELPAEGKRIVYYNGTTEQGTPDPATAKTFEVIGVVRDFNFQSLKKNIDPLGFVLGQAEGTVAIRFNAESESSLITTVENTWKKFAPGLPIKYSFLADDFARMYDNEQQLGKIFNVFAGLAMLIGCLGLFALSAFIAQQRTKEIAIRKVHGAGIGSIVLLLSRNFGVLILVSFIIALPMAWYGVDRWLEDYTYKVSMGWGSYTLVAVGTLVIALVTISYQAIEAAFANPIRSLRNE